MAGFQDGEFVNRKKQGRTDVAVRLSSRGFLWKREKPDTLVPKEKDPMKITQIFCLTVAAVLLAMVASPVLARSHISDVIDKGSRWTLNVDGETGVLEVLGGQGHRTPDGGWQMEMDVTWQGRRGKLYGRADGQNRDQHVTLNVRRRGGIRVLCRGFVAQETGYLMAGQSSYSAVPHAMHGAWYAGKHR